jgi:uncharacterized protein YjbJ (UPF0337 family)
MDPRVRRIWRFFALFPGRHARDPDTEVAMGLLDKLLGRGKKAAGDLAGDSSLRREGIDQEHQGLAEERAEKHEEKAQAARTEAAAHKAKREAT